MSKAAPVCAQKCRTPRKTIMDFGFLIFDCNLKSNDPQAGTPELKIPLSLVHRFFSLLFPLGGRWKIDDRFASDDPSLRSTD